MMDCIVISCNDKKEAEDLSKLFIKSLKFFDDNLSRGNRRVDTKGE